MSSFYDGVLKKYSKFERGKRILLGRISFQIGDGLFVSKESREYCESLCELKTLSNVGVNAVCSNGRRCLCSIYIALNGIKSPGTGLNAR